MTPDRRPVHRQMTFEEFCARTREEEEGSEEAESPLPPEWRNRPRKRASRRPPDFEVEGTQALEWARVHAGCWKPEVVSYKRLAGGKTAMLVRDKLGSAITLVLDRGEVVDVRTEQEFRALEEVLRG